MRGMSAPAMPLSHQAERLTPDDAIRLDIGGDEVRPGWTIVDRKVGTEAYPLAYADNSVDEIEASHILEHFPERQKVDVLRDWVRVLKPNGKIRVAVPDLAVMCRLWIEGKWDPSWPEFDRVVYGGQVDDNDFHKSAYHEADLRSAMQQAGLVCIQPWQGRPTSSAIYPFSLNLEGIKPPSLESLAPGIRRDIVGVMSVPRLAWTENKRALEAAIHSLGFPVHSDTGAYVMQGFERSMERYLDSAKYILTIDYDTVFSTADVAGLYLLMEQHPEVDALAPLQVKRGGTHWLIGHAMKRDDLAHDVAETKSAHFGLTMFRAERLKDLPHPWMLPVPGPDGRWGDGRLDEDIRFWQHFREHGRRVFLAPRVTVGHLEVVVAWPDRLSLRTVYQQIDQYQDNGPPRQVFGGPVLGG